MSTWLAVVRAAGSADSRVGLRRSEKSRWQAGCCSGVVIATFRKPRHDAPWALLIVCGLLAASQVTRAQTTGSADRVAIANAQPDAQTAPTPLEWMTAEERLHQYYRNLVSPTSLLSAGAAAGIGQWRDRPTAWGLGSEGYARRYASAYVEHFERETLAFGLSSAFHEDNRYVPSGRAGAGARIGYAVESTFLARHEDGSRHLSISRLAAFAGAAALSRMWQPRANRTIGGGVANFGTSLSVAVGFNVAREFLPRLFH
jgi:hypothetical protein